MAADATTTLATLNDHLAVLQHSARKTIPMFLLGIVATFIAAGAAVYYILTLSADARNSRHALAESQAALATVTKALEDANAQLREKEKTASSPADASAIKAAIANNSATQAIVSSASTAVRQATARLDATDPSVRQAVTVRRPVLSGATVRRPVPSDNTVTPQNRPELAGQFVTLPTSDGFLALRSQPGMNSELVRKLPAGSVLTCEQASPNPSRNLWRPCADDQGNSGYVANKFIRQQR